MIACRHQYNAARPSAFHPAVKSVSVLLKVVTIDLSLL